MARLVFAALVAGMASVLPGAGGPGAVADHTAGHDEGDGFALVRVRRAEEGDR